MWRLKKCPICTAEHRNTVYCSRKCYGKASRKNNNTFTCKQCSTTFERKIGGKSAPLRGKYCSRKCSHRSQMTEVKTTSDLRRTSRYNEWRKKVYARDDYTCQICGVRGGILDADHIKPLALYPELGLDLNNGRTLCRTCHRRTDTYGRRSVQPKRARPMYAVLPTGERELIGTSYE